jgi:single-strand DNA-binding protein
MANFNLNKVIIGGRLTTDPELKTTPSGIPVVSFTVAVNRRFGSKAGEESTADFFNVTAWRQTAEFVSKYFSKGRMAVVSGRLQIRNWTDKDGNKRRTAEVIADNVYFADSKNSNGNAPALDAMPVIPEQDFAMLNDDDVQLPF